jgi:4-hydroxy-3-polyprenylbenzoate decarboxylase
MHALWGLGLMSLSKAIVVVDEHVDVHDYEQVFFYLCANLDPARDVELSEGPIDQLDHATTVQALGGKIGFDATAKGPGEGRREWPPEIEMTADVRARVDARWAELGLPAAPSGATMENGGRARTLTQLLRR